MTLMENLLAHIVPDEAIPEMVEMSARRLGIVLQDLRKSLHEAGVTAKLDFPRMVENLAGEEWREIWGRRIGLPPVRVRGGGG